MAPPQELLANVDLFRDLDKRELREIAIAMKEYTFDAGREIVTQGQNGVGFFVIADGEARVELHGERRATLRQGASFGEVALLDETGRRSASVIAESPMRVFGITAWQFTPLLEQNPAIAVKIAKGLARMLREEQDRIAAVT